MAKKLIVFDSHPVQYRVPVWRELTSIQPGSVHVVYASDCSVRGHADQGFGKVVAWDDPMMTGYDHTVLNCENGTPLTGWKSLTGKGVGKLLDEQKPDAVLLTGLNYRYDWAAYFEARKRGIPTWLRCETQDEAQVRSRMKGMIRSLLYRLSYKQLDRIFYIGKLNQRHYLNHGVSPQKLTPAFYATVDRFHELGEERKQEMRKERRSDLQIPDDALVIGFSGKFIPKKNPDILYKMLDHLPDSIRSRVVLYFIGSGAMEGSLKLLAREAEVRYGVKSWFTGFVNQSALASHYLAMDVLVLPSRRMGETWGLVANEAMQAGCGVITSNAVGCHADFGELERFRTFPDGHAGGLATQIVALSSFKRSFNWATRSLEPYSIKRIAETLRDAINTIKK